MATLEILTLTCDVCGRDGTDARPVETHTLSVDGGAPRELEACGRCWTSKSLTALLDVSRRRRRA